MPRYSPMYALTPTLGGASPAYARTVALDGIPFVTLEIPFGFSASYLDVILQQIVDALNHAEKDAEPSPGHKKFIPGDQWKTRGGHIVTIVAPTGVHLARGFSVEGTYGDDMRCTFTHHGRYLDGGETSDMDLMEKVYSAPTEPKPVPKPAEAHKVTIGSLWQNKKSGCVYIAAAIKPEAGVGASTDCFNLVNVKTGGYWSFGRGFDGRQDQFQYRGQGDEVVTIVD